MPGFYFTYGEKEKEYLKSKDKKLALVIDKIGHIHRETEPDLFSAIVNSIIGQQISSKAHKTVWLRLQAELGEINPDTVLNAGALKIQQLGTTFKKADYILDFAASVKSGKFRLNTLNMLPDNEAMAELMTLKGVGIWTGEMVMLFCLQRPNILSYGDLAIRRGMCMVYNHKEMNKERFERYRRRLSPYCSVASLYFWAVAGGAYK